jgi:hypothetical protein
VEIFVDLEKKVESYEEKKRKRDEIPNKLSLGTEGELEEQENDPFDTEETIVVSKDEKLGLSFQNDSEGILHKQIII